MASISRPSTAAALTLAIAALLLVLAGGLLIVSVPAWSVHEVRVVAAVNAAHAPVLDVLAHGLNVVFGPVGALALSLVAAVGAGIAQRSWTTSARVAVLIAVPWALSSVLKLIVGRPRPDPVELAHPSGLDPSTLSFPSGHTAIAAAIMVTLILLTSHRHRRSMFAATIVVVLVTGWSRVYLGVHYPTDVIASVVLVPATVIALDRLLTGILGTPLISPSPAPRTEVVGPPGAPPAQELSS